MLFLVHNDHQVIRISEWTYVSTHSQVVGWVLRLLIWDKEFLVLHYLWISIIGDTGSTKCTKVGFSVQQNCKYTKSRALWNFFQVGLS